MGTGRHGGRANPHSYPAHDVGMRSQGETLPAALTSAPRTGALGRQTEGERIDASSRTTPRSGALKNETQGETLPASKTTTQRTGALGRETQGETLPANSTTAPRTGAVGRELEGETLRRGKPVPGGGSLETQTKGEVRSTKSKPFGASGANDKNSGSGMATDPPVSEAQRTAMGAAMSGKSNLGIPKSVGKEFIDADPGGALPAKSK